MALTGSQQRPVASYDTWFLKGFYPLHSTFTPPQGSASRVSCQEWVESQQGRILAHRALTPCQRDATQEERVCHGFKPISTRVSSKIHHGMRQVNLSTHDMVVTARTLCHMSWCWAEKHQTSPCPCSRFQLVLPPKTPLQQQRMDVHGA